MLSTHLLPFSTASNLVLTGCMTLGFITSGYFVCFPLQLKTLLEDKRAGSLHILRCWTLTNSCQRLGICSVDYKNIFQKQETHVKTILLLFFALSLAFDTPSQLTPLDVCSCIYLSLGKGHTQPLLRSNSSACGGNNERVCGPRISGGQREGLLTLGWPLIRILPLSVS